ncbi:MAG: BrnT family toxin [Draconibacterium sp.]|nr:BrnT family toxin [Draconibacterium sp.]
MYIFAIYMKGIFSDCEGFEWDKGNSEKNWIRHKVMQGECEQVFFNEPIIVLNDVTHSQTENRWFLLGKTDTERLLFIVFTIRGNSIRVISARDMNKKERKNYYEQT